ncbi:hypothetical protein AB0G04_15455 [Actinoplanes sp. NPDC023801]|uniref:hypothetical protein n=1 Tax=Actinoplanes sp. NPDC023801 TaxID=3154595 RepID=UPI0033D78247
MRDDDAMLRLGKGITGFRHGREPQLPEVPVRRFRGACHEAARAAGGTVERVTERAYPANFHSAVIVTPAGRSAILCNAVHPWIAFVEENTGDVADPGTFLDPPPWAAAFSAADFGVLGRTVLDSPLDTADTTALGKGEWLQIHSWRPETVGRTVFNSWD